MRTPSLVLLPALLAVLVLAGPAAAAPSPGVGAGSGGLAGRGTAPGSSTGAGSSDAPLGGPRLAADGVVVDDDAPALPDGLTATSWLVADLDSGQVLAAQDAHSRHAPASTLKTLTAVALIPELDRDRTVVPTFDDVAVEGSKVGLVEDVAYPVHELFTALMAVSGNDAANVLASAAGGQQAAAKLMNDKARSLQARNTVAVNPHGLDAEGQVSSAYDLALIARAGMADPQFAAYAATRQGSVAAPGGQRISIATKNRLLRSYDGALGIKNGYTTAARASFIGAAERDGRRLLVTLMRAEPKVADEAAKLLDWGFAAVGTVTPVGLLVDPLPEPGAAGGTSTGAAAGARAEGARAAAGAGAAEGARAAAGAGAAAAAPLAGLRAPASAAAAGDGGGLVAAVAGLGLAAAAVLSVRHRPQPVRSPAAAAARPPTSTRRRAAGSAPAGSAPARPAAAHPAARDRPTAAPAVRRAVAARVGAPGDSRPRRSGVA